MKRSIRIAVELLLVIPIFAFSLFAQAGVSTAEIKGRITDPNGAVLKGATVTLVDSDRGANRAAVTDDQGEYRFLSLQPGTYSLKVDSAGFRSAVKNAVIITVGQTADHDFSLTVGEATAVVEITSDQPLIETDQSQQSTTINERYIRDLPIDRRDYLTFTLLAPGVVDSNALADNADFRVTQTPQSGISFYGNNGRGNSITVDGSEANDQGGGVRSNLGQEAVQEFQVNRANYNAELGGASGGVINIVSKTGTNDFHGSAFAYFRHHSLDAGDPFAIVLDGANNTISRIKPAANRQQYGFTLGGPFIKDKLFFFGGYEGLRRRESSTVPLLTNLNIFQPTAAQSSILTTLAAQGGTIVNCGTAAAPNNIPANICAAALQSVLTIDNVTPAEKQVQDLFRQNSGVFPFNTDSHSLSFRIDYVPSATNSFSLKYSWNDRAEGNQATRALLGFSRSNNTDILDHNLSGSWTHLFSTNASNELRLQANYNELFVTPTDPNGPELNVAGFGFFNRDIFLPARNTDRRLEVVDNFSLVTGDHRLKFGGSYLQRNGTFDDETFFSGRFGFGSLPGGLISSQLATTTINSVQSLNLGLPQTYQQGFGNGIVSGRLPYFSFYGQDTWKALSNLTLNYGLRYEIDVRRKPLRTSYGSVGPRVGFAWDPFGKSKTIVRGGYGMFYAQVPFVIDYVVQSLGEVDGVRQIPQVLSTIQLPSSISAPTIFRTLRAQGRIGIPNTVPTIAPADLAQFGFAPFNENGPFNPFAVVFRADDTYQNPRAQQASVAFEHEFATGFSFGASYVWALTQHITRARDINLNDRPINSGVGIRSWGTATSIVPGTCTGATDANCFRSPLVSVPTLLGGAPLPAYLQEIIYESAASANYHGFILEVQKQWGANFALAGNYTLSKAKDQVVDYNSDFRAMDQTFDDPEYSLSSFDQRHKFVVYAVITTPWKNAFARDWTLTPIFRANSGRPFNLLSGVDINSDRSTNGDRPLLNATFNPAGQVVTAEGAVARNTGKGPAFATFDMRLTRKIRFNENISLDLTAEAFNLLNRLNYSAVNNTVGVTVSTPALSGDHDANPSQPLGFTSAFDPRRIQFGVKLRF